MVLPARPLGAESATLAYPYVTEHPNAVVMEGATVHLNYGGAFRGAQPRLVRQDRGLGRSRGVDVVERVRRNITLITRSTKSS